MQGARVHSSRLAFTMYLKPQHMIPGWETAIYDVTCGAAQGAGFDACLCAESELKTASEAWEPCMVQKSDRAVQ